MMGSASAQKETKGLMLKESALTASSTVARCVMNSTNANNAKGGWIYSMDCASVLLEEKGRTVKGNARLAMWKAVPPVLLEIPIPVSNVWTALLPSSMASVNATTKEPSGMIWVSARRLRKKQSKWPSRK